MELINAIALQRGWRKHPQIRVWLQNWIAVVEQAAWQSLQDVRATFPSADGVKLGSGRVVTVVNVGGNDYRLLTTIAYSTQKAYCWEVLTHAEYSKDQWKKRM